MSEFETILFGSLNKRSFGQSNSKALPCEIQTIFQPDNAEVGIVSRFNDIMEVVFKWEGGYVDHPDDPGGATNLGITHKVLAEWRGVPAVTRKEVQDLTRDEATDIFKARYFDVIRGSRLPAPIDLIMMDGAVNHGTRNMVRFLENALGLTENGRLSKADIGLLAEKTAEQQGLIEIAVQLADARKARYLSRPHAATFIRGWRNRLNDIMDTAFAPLSGSWTFGRGYDRDISPGGGTDPEPLSTIIRPAIEDDELQAALTTWGDYTGDIDGMFGPLSLAATDRALERNAAGVSGDWRRWATNRKKLAIGQLICKDLEIEVGRIDGLFGPLTEAAFISFNRLRLSLPADRWRDELDEIHPQQPHSPVVPSATVWPRQRDLVDFYGKECTSGDQSGSCGRGDVRLKRLQLPFEMKIAWDLSTTISGFSIHEKVHDSAAKVFDKIYAEYGDDGIEDLGVNLFGGCYNCRKIRGGSRCSTHAWAIAIDFDPAHNKLRWDHKLARLAKPDAVKFWQFWEAEGWLSLGRARDYDWMHVQAARL